MFTPAGKLVLWEVEHVIRFTAAGSSETEFGHCRQYLINVMEWSLAFSGRHSKRLTQHIYPLLYILPLSYFLLTTSLADWFCLFLSGNSFISSSLPVVCHAVCVCFCSQSSWAQVTGPFCAHGLHTHRDVTLPSGMNMTKERISHRNIMLHFSSSFYKRLNPLCFDRNLHDHDAWVQIKFLHRMAEGQMIGNLRK